MKKMMIAILILVGVVAVATVLVLNQRSFGAAPKGERLKRIQSSPNYKDGAFQNIEITPVLENGFNYFDVLKKGLFPTAQALTPEGQVPSEKVDLKSLSKEENAMVWFGHSSVYFQLDGASFLVDPVFSGAASPFSFMVNAFDGTDRYTADDMPHIDFLLITHDHWDHLDYETILALKSRVLTFVCPLGVGAHLERWGISSDHIVEGDWWETYTLNESVKLTFTPSRHFSGRGLKRNQTLWTSFVVEAAEQTVFLSGDGGFGSHIATIKEKFPQIDLAVLENGQYDLAWQSIHMLPEEVAKGVEILEPKVFLPIHSGKFKLANHSWNEPLDSLTNIATRKALPILTPKIGEKVVWTAPVEESVAKWW